MQLNNSKIALDANESLSQSIEINTVKIENQRTIIQSLNGIFFFNEDWISEPETIDEVDIEDVSI